MTAIDIGKDSAFRQQVDHDLKTILASPLPWQNLTGRTILVTGATGFIGSYIVETLLAVTDDHGQGVKAVLAHVRSGEKAARRFAEVANSSRLVVLEGDVVDAVAIDEPIDIIVHAASPASPRHYLTDPVGVLRANLTGTEWLLDLARCKEARVIFFSSGEVYGQTDIVPTPETGYGYLDPTSVRACYGEGKRAAETMCVAWAHQFGVEVSIVRPFHTYGPGIALDDGRVFADFVADILASRDIVMHSDGQATRAFCYIADAVAAFFTVLFHGKRGTAYNVGNPAGEISIVALAHLLVSMYPEKNLKVVHDPAGPDSVYAPSPIVRNVPSIDRIRALGWSPQISIGEGFSKMIDSYG